MTFTRPIVFPPHEKAATLDDVRAELAALRDDVGEKHLAVISAIGSLAMEIRRLKRKGPK